MQLGVMTSVFDRPTVEEVASAIRSAGLTAVQLSLRSVGLEELPSAISDANCLRIQRAFDANGLEISGVSGYFNAIDPDLARRAESIRRLGELTARCRLLGTKVVGICTGTRNATSMWRHHPANALPDAWADCVATMRELVAIADRNDVILAFEPEVVNVVDTAEKAVRLIDEVGSRRLRVIMDPANYFHPPMLSRVREVVEEAFRLVGGYIALAHAKDVRGPNPGGQECVRPAAGTGVLDYATYIRELRACGYAGGLIMHSLGESEVAASKAYVERFL